MGPSLGGEGDTTDWVNQYENQSGKGKAKWSKFDQYMSPCKVYEGEYSSTQD